MKKLLGRRIIRQFIKFGVVGVLSTIIDWGIFYFLNGLAVYYLTAKIISFSVAVINSFVWNRKWTFRSSNPKKLHEFGKFISIALLGLVFNALIMFLAIDHFHYRKIVGLIFATSIVMFWNFLANKFYTFKESQA